jgi:DNA-binding NarL/FixJ family response regulator
VPASFATIGDGNAVSSRFDREALPTLSTEADVLKLTKRQREVLSLLARGLSNKEIARALDIAEATTKIHMAALLRGLGVRNRTEAAFKAANLVHSTEPAASQGRQAARVAVQ